jgi:NADPH-dependent 2,4-dienoyl-CoA reductase/sulfur reductase-like enzyme
MEEAGGILPQCIHQGFGLRYFKEELTGPEYAWRFIDELQGYPQIIYKPKTMVTQLTPERRVYAASSLEGLVCYQAGAVILAMGCRERPRGALNIPGTRPAGIYTAGAIQRLMNIEGFRPGNRAVILGSGDIGLIMARRLTLEGIKVLAVLEILPYSAGLTRNLVQCLEDFQIPLLLNHTIIEIHGEGRVTGVTVAPVMEPSLMAAPSMAGPFSGAAERRPIQEKSFKMECDTVLLSVGLIPENELSIMAGVQLDEATGGPWVDSAYQTSVSGIFACGNVVHVHDLVDDVSEEGQTAGEAAARFLADRGQVQHNKSPYVLVKPGRNIRSIVPQYLRLNQPTTLYIRVRFPERDAILTVGGRRVKQRVVTPGETIRYRLKAEELSEIKDLQVSIEKEGGANG